MAMNKYIHSRNIYKNPPNFKKLADNYPEFAIISQMDVTGKISIDFKDPHALRVLTACLLKSDFNLDVVIPKDRLVPTLPLRLNYVLWIEDLLNAIDRRESIYGIDIGTGACAIYPMLAAKKNNWHMIGTETDDDSIKIAKENVERNNLDNLIKIRKNSTKSTLEYLFVEDTEQKYDFCMCNPPFYVNIQEVWESRSPARPPPKNGFTGSPQELITEGGELQFCRQILEESKKLKDKILLFTSMIGHKYNLKELLLDLKAEGIKHTSTEFCQGRVTRWGIAWTYQDYDLFKLVPPREKPRKKSLPITLIVPKLPDQPYNMETVAAKLKNLLDNLKIQHKVITKRKNELCLDLKAYINTWSNQRRKRRLLKQLEGKAKKSKLDEPGTSEAEISIETINNNGSLVNSEEENTSATEIESTGKVEILNENPLAHAFLKLVGKDDTITLSLEYLSGTLGKEGLHQILQYIKNNWK
ncbi:U6 small nuclear RNA (adenine-(43)-N(6))-methyltransferase [Colias croceus]|uniref:U6 small nuclear RNA (adenine-(43)-N(6))-methyltransferase n=1 Tax=Colias crocea TaxID=72248 RepID=UPI001E27E760|nr:U6 small nuclear RNA (adenine-(43)-N(6))-methyltransferase [Colias croceus]